MQMWQALILSFVLLVIAAAGQPLNHDFADSSNQADQRALSTPVACIKTDLLFHEAVDEQLGQILTDEFGSFASYHLPNNRGPVRTEKTGSETVRYVKTFSLKLLNKRDEVDLNHLIPLRSSTMERTYYFCAKGGPDGHGSLSLYAVDSNERKILSFIRQGSASCHELNTGVDYQVEVSPRTPIWSPLVPTGHRAPAFLPF